MYREVDQLVDGQATTFGGLTAVVAVSVRRKRLGLTIERDGSLVVRVPVATTYAVAERFVHDNRRWIDAKLALWQRHRPLNETARLTEGEIHRYLGREYRLALVDAPGQPVRLNGGRFLLDRQSATDPLRARKELRAWYCQAGSRWARGRLQPWAGRMEVTEPHLVVRDVGRRWGTYRARPEVGAGQGVMALHWALFQLPPRLVDYVIAHELAHIRIADHGPDYWRLLHRALPEYEALKAELDEMGRHTWLGALAE